ncbi:flavin-containing monooxygenase [Mycobacterium sp. NPDC003449]
MYDAIVVGAGFAGLYQLHRLRELGLNVVLLEAGDDVGGVWYWNRYPGARFDSESYTYAYSFSERLVQEWDWTELFAGQPEVQRYLSRMAEMFDLRPSIRFGSVVEAATYIEEDPSWSVRLVTGEVFAGRLLVTAVGLLSIPVTPEIKDLEKFGGRCWHSSRWPSDISDLTGKRVAVFGTGSTGVQIITELAREVEQLYVFQRHPSWCVPLQNRPITAPERRDLKTRYREIFDLCRQTPAGFLHAPDGRKSYEVSAEERRALWEKLYYEPGFAILYSNFADVLIDPSVNKELCEFIAGKYRERIDDPEVAEKLIPHDHEFGSRRLVLESGYLEVYNRPNVHLVDLLHTPVERVTETAIVTGDATYDVDAIVFATGFDAMTGSFDNIDIKGRGGVKLADAWHDGPVTYLGFQTPDFPNLIMIGGPQAGSGASNFPRGLEDGVDWATALIAHAFEKGANRIEVTREAARWWQEHMADMLRRYLVGHAKSWFTGYNSNLAGRDKPRLLLYMGGAPLYRRILARVVEMGYEGFTIANGDKSTADAERSFTVPFAPR